MHAHARPPVRTRRHTRTISRQAYANTRRTHAQSSETHTAGRHAKTGTPADWSIRADACVRSAAPLAYAIDTTTPSSRAQTPPSFSFFAHHCARESLLVNVTHISGSRSACGTGMWKSHRRAHLLMKYLARGQLLLRHSHSPGLVEWSSIGQKTALTSK
eukprot:2717619-Pleurochrysis_carterae.AAC.1